MPKNPTDHQTEPQAEHVQPAQECYVPAASLYDEDSVDLFEYWDILVRSKLTILITSLLITALAVIIAFIMTPRYKADVLMAPITEDKSVGAMSGLATQFGGLASFAGIQVAGSGEVNEAVATLKSRAFTEKFIKDKNLLRVLFYNKWDEENGKWKENETDKIPTMWDAYKLFDKKIRTVSIDDHTGLITLSILWKDREQAVQWANMLVDRVNRTLRDRAIAEAEKSLDFLNRELAKTSVVELQKVIYRLIEGQTNKIMLANVREEYAFKVIDPAVVPDEDEFVKPKRKLIIFFGLFTGFFIGIGIVFIQNLRVNRRQNSE